MTARDEIKQLALQYSQSLNKAINSRVIEMEDDDTSHYLLYRVLGIAEAEGKLIDVYQNKGRFLYKYAGSFLEAATKLCFREAFPGSGSLRIPNTRGQRPKTFEIDCLVGTSALEIKWKDATTDGDHITKEHTRIKVIADAGHTPIRVMFYYPNRTQAIRIQETLKTLYEGIGGHYYYGEGAWSYVKAETKIDLKNVLEEIAAERAGKIEVLSGK
jgi:ApaLI-like restriction endonuclease